MSDKKTGQENLRKLTRMGKGSLGLTLPMEMVKKLKLKERQIVKLSLKGRTILIRDWNK